MKSKHLNFGRIVVARESLPITKYNQFLFEGSVPMSQEKTLNELELLNLVPRAGLEPARPYLTNPRILSPALNEAIYIDQFDNSDSLSAFGPHSGRTELSSYSHQYPNFTFLNHIIKTASRQSLGEGFIYGKAFYGYRQMEAALVRRIKPPRKAHLGLFIGRL